MARRKVKYARGGILSHVRRFDAGGYAADDMSEAAQRARNSPLMSVDPNETYATPYQTTIGGNRVSIGDPGVTDDAGAIAALRSGDAYNSSVRNGALDPKMWAALNPGASAQDTADYGTLNRAYKQGTTMRGPGTKLSQAGKFELNHISDIVKGAIHNPTQLVFGIDPLGTKIGNAITGQRNDPLVGQLGGATSKEISDYEALHGKGSSGAARALHTSASDIAGMVGGAKLGATLGTQFGGAGALGDSGATVADAAAPAAADVGSGAGALTSAATDEALPTILVQGTRLGAGLGTGAGALGGGALSTYQNTVNMNNQTENTDTQEDQHASPTDPGSTTQTPAQKSMMERLMAYIKANPIQAAQRAGTIAGLLGGLGGKGGGNSGPPAFPPGFGGVSTGTDVLPQATMNRTYIPYAGDYNRYGMGPEHTYYGKAAGGALHRFVRRSPHTASNGVGALNQFVSKGTGAGGREDNIDAKLSENEYVVDAETVALLGDGSPEAGAKKLDKMRASIRQHKGKALASGKISPDAKAHPLQYLADGGAVRPKQPLNAALDVQDDDFDKWLALPRKERKGAIGDYNRRFRTRVGDATYDIAPPPPMRVARNSTGGK